MKSETRRKTYKLTSLALLMAVIVIMSFTPVGYLKVGIVTITFITIPVAIGASTFGVAYGATLGLVFGITSFIQCLTIDEMGIFLFSVNPFLTFVVCVVPRILVGIVPALISRLLKKKVSEKIYHFVSAFSCALSNTVFFGAAMICFFGSLTYANTTIKDLMIAAILTNGLIEMIVACFIGGAVSLAVSKAINNIE